MDHIVMKTIETEFHLNSMNRKDDIVLNGSWKPLIYTKRNGGGIISIHTCIMMPPPTSLPVAPFTPVHPLLVLCLAECPVTICYSIWDLPYFLSILYTQTFMDSHNFPCFLLAHVLHICWDSTAVFLLDVI
jgi:hypothetical protein